MDEEIITTPDVQPDAAADTALPADTDASVVPDNEATSDSSEPSQDVEAQPNAPQVDDQLQKFARSQGIELDSPNAIKAAQALQKARGEATRNYQKVSELEKVTNITQEQLPDDATTQQVDTARLRNMEIRMEVQGWKMQNQDKLTLEADMVKILSDPKKKELVQAGYLSLDDIYSLAKASAPDNSAEVSTQASQKTLQNLAQKMQAAVPTGHATTNAGPKEKDFRQLSSEERRAKLGVVRPG